MTVKTNKPEDLPDIEKMMLAWKENGQLDILKTELYVDWIRAGNPLSVIVKEFPELTADKQAKIVILLNVASDIAKDGLARNMLMKACAPGGMFEKK